MEQLKHMKETLVSQVQAQLCNLAAVDTKELGEVIDMIKDLEEAMYYCTIIESMEEKGEEKEGKQVHNHYAYYTAEPVTAYRDIDKQMGRMYYPMEYNRMYYPESGERGPNDTLRQYNGGGGGGSGSGGSGSSGGSSGGGGGRGGSSSGGRGSTSQYSERELPFEFRDAREGRSPTSRKMYMESKDMNHDKAKKMKELEKYMQELTLDIAEMIEDSSPEEKQLLHKKISALANKIETL